MIALEQAAFLTGGLSGAAGASGPPATPDASQAREAAERELSKPAYAEKTDPLSALALQDEGEAEPRERGQRARDITTENHLSHFPSAEIEQSAARRSASR